MAQTPEGKVKDKAKVLFKKYGAKYDRNAATGMGQNGRADDLVCRRPDGHFGGVEYKRDRVWKVSALQRIWLKDTEACGGSSMVVNLTNLEMLERWLAEPGWRVNAVFGDPDRPDVCTGHVARKVGFSDSPGVEIKNPGT